MRETGQVANGPEPPQTPPIKMPRISPPMTLGQMRKATEDMMVDFVLLVVDLPRSDILAGMLLEPDEAEPFNAPFRKTSERFEVQWTPTIRFAMGTANDLAVGSILRVVRRLGENHLVRAEQLVVLTRVARIV